MKIDKKRKHTNTNDGNRNPESSRGRRSRASQVVIQRKPGHVVSKKDPTRIGTWNVRTLLSSGRLELKQQMREKQLDVLGVCETRWGDNDF